MTHSHADESYKEKAEQKKVGPGGFHSFDGCEKWANLTHAETSLAVQWLRLRASTAGGTVSIPGRDPACHVVKEKKKTTNPCGQE